MKSWWKPSHLSSSAHRPDTPWKHSGEKQQQQHICCSRSWSSSQREGFGSTGFCRSPSVDKRTSPVLGELLCLLIAARPLWIYLTVLTVIAVLEHTWLRASEKDAMEEQHSTILLAMTMKVMENLSKNPNSRKILKSVACTNSVCQVSIAELCQCFAYYAMLALQVVPPYYALS